MSDKTSKPPPGTQQRIAEQAGTLSAAEEGLQPLLAGQICAVAGPGKRSLRPKAPEQRRGSDEAAVTHSTSTERKQEALRSSEEYARNILDNLAAFVGLFTPDGIVLEANRPPLERAGLRREDVIGKEFAETYWWNYAPGVQAQIRDAFRRAAQGETVSGDFQSRMANNEISDLFVVFAPLCDAGGTVVQVVVSGFDITGRKQTENALRESNEKFQQLAGNIDDALWIRSPDMRELHYISPGFERIWGRSMESLGANPHQWIDFILPEDRARVLSAFAALQAEARSVDIEYRIATPAGDIRWVRVRGFQVRDAADKLIRLIGIVSDITERQLTAEALRTSLEEISRTNRALQSEIMERKHAELAAETANRTKGEFLANMSHEIRTPLNGVLGMTELALGLDLSTEQREYLDMVKSSGESLLSVINDILDFSKIDAGMLAVDPIPFDLSNCLTTSLKLLATRAHVKGLELACDIRPDVPTAVIGDPSRLRQIVTNLIGNAIKFTDHGEVVLTVETETETDKKATLRFSVSDTGIGIPQEKQEAVFKPFMQADGSTTRKYGGTGLGLAIATNLVVLLGGSIGLKSKVGKGSTFHFTMPFDLQRTLVNETPARHSQMMHLRDMPILVVDDNAVNRRILEAMLKRWLMKPVLAESGRTGVATFQAGKLAGTPFPLVLIDSQMPEMDGFSVAGAIKKDPGLAGSTVLMLTSTGRQGDVARCRTLGIAAYLMKPISEAELLEAILTVLGKPSAGPEQVQVVTRHTLRENRGKLRVLLVEDVIINQVIAARMLEKRGHTVVIAGNGKEALAAMDVPASAKFDLVLMDVQMPEMDGMEATGIIRAREKLSGTHLPIIAMTAHAMKGDQERCLAAGMDDYLSKPFQAEKVFATIDSVLSTRDLRAQ